MADLPQRAAGEFETTHWSRVIAASDVDSERSKDALAALCESYHYPLYVYVRRRVASADEANDLTQEFFATLLEKRYLAAADPERGRFRAFLLTAMKNFLSNQWAKAKAIKRGGGVKHFSIDFDESERRFRNEPASDEPAERQYLRQWASAVLERSFQRLEEKFSRAGKTKEFQAYARYLNHPDAEGGVPEVAKRLGISEGAARTASSRFRAGYRELIRSEVAQTLMAGEDLDDEVDMLFRAFE